MMEWVQWQKDLEQQGQQGQQWGYWTRPRAQTARQQVQELVEQDAPDVPWEEMFSPDRYANANQTQLSEELFDFLDNECEKGRDYSPSEILRMALENAGVEAPEDAQAHHIVESSNEEGQHLLRIYNIDPNSAVNGVFLPTRQWDGMPDVTIHLGSHIRGYTDCVNEALRKAIDEVFFEDPISRIEEAIIDCLNTIRKILLTEVVPLNSRVDPNFNPETNSGETIREIFVRKGLI